jgi:hypothetical protein
MWKHYENNRFLWWLTGESPPILAVSTQKAKRLFSKVGLLILCILIISSISVTYGVTKLLENYILGIVAGIYSAFLFLLLYLFILYTFTRNVLPGTEKSNRGLTVSKVLRFGFLFILGLTISQPIEHWMFSSQVDKLLDKEIEISIKERNLKLNREYAVKLNELLSLNYSHENLQEELSRFREEKKIRLKNFAENQYQRNFFIQRMILMDTSPQTRIIWVFSLLFILLFTSPILLKTKIPLESDYYNRNKQIQMRLIEDHHSAFVNRFNQIYHEKFGRVDLKWKSPYLDPPYNTKLAETPKAKNESDFIKWLLNEGN